MLIQQYEGRVLACVVEVLLVVGEVFGVERLLLWQIVETHKNVLVRKEGQIDDSLDQRHVVREFEQCMRNIRWR